ncbi:Holliday junction resolvase RuvX [Psychromonas antarctica]|jgi:putative Holliday junction resolvase|uniref:Holliday junction resolvase RuvX n=1 Tax=Psychromonas antarctica TaxID=67573 RepID=UPI001EE8372A|nr:Holliday junction resolvase RuvX [Psychromonas antarctica]MCG6201974.1 Holliday junction resolvase RuvX [Psychromonas antarctica]
MTEKSNSPSRLLGFDFGTKSIGVATGQMITATAQPIAAIKANDGIPDWAILEKLINEWRPDLVVIGLPLNMDGTEQPITQRAKKFANRLNGRFGVKTALQDERLTTASAKEFIFANGGYKALDKGKIDSVSAALILESWMESYYG